MAEGTFTWSLPQEELASLSLLIIMLAVEIFVAVLCQIKAVNFNFNSV